LCTECTVGRPKKSLLIKDYADFRDFLPGVAERVGFEPTDPLSDRDVESHEWNAELLELGIAYGESFFRRVRSIGIRGRPDVFPLILAKRLRRTVDRFNPKGMN
jgi:hypothetical protein